MREESVSSYGLPRPDRSVPFKRPLRSLGELVSQLPLLAFHWQGGSLHKPRLSKPGCLTGEPLLIRRFYNTTSFFDVDCKRANWKRREICCHNIILPQTFAHLRVTPTLEFNVQHCFLFIPGYNIE